MSRRQNKKREESLRREVEEIERKVDESIALDQKILSEQELKSLKLVQNSNGGKTAVPTDNTVLAGGAPANISAIPSGGVLPTGKSVNFTVDNPNVSLAAGAPDSAGNPTVDVTVPATEPAGSFNVGANVTRTDGTVITASPLKLTIVTAPAAELTSLSLKQNS